MDKSKKFLLFLILLFLCIPLFSETVKIAIFPQWQPRTILILFLIAGISLVFIILLRLLVSQTKKNLINSERQYQDLFNGSRTVMLVINPKNGKIVDANKTALLFYGYSLESICNKNIKDINISGDKTVNKDLQSAASNEQNFFIFQHKTAAGEIKTVEVYSNPIHRENKILLFSIIHDISEKKNLEEKSKQLETDLRRSQKMDALGRMAGGIAHDFNNLLGAIMGYLELLKLKINPEKQNYYIEQAYSAGNRAKKLIKQILTVSRKTEQNFRKIDLVKIVRETLDLMERTIPKTIKIDIEIPSHPVIIQGDENLLEQIIMNLCNNSVFAIQKTMDNKSSKGRIIIRLTENNTSESAVLQICDNGIGIKQNEMEKIFDPYYTTKKPDEGTGLGLSIVQGIIEIHKGTIMAKSADITCFTITLPIIGADETIEEEENKMNMEAGHKERILVVDDEKDIIYITTEILKKMNYTTDSANDGNDAWNRISKGEHYDLILSDISMPQMDGLTFLKKMEESLINIPVVLMTGNLRTIDKSISREKLLLKPFSSKSLVEIINKNL